MNNPVECPVCGIIPTKYGCICTPPTAEELQRGVDAEGLSVWGFAVVVGMLAITAVVSLVNCTGRAVLGKTPTHTITVSGTPPDDRDAGE